jgi:TRAP-type C4-dicarboxylate transport system permease small subunit
MVAAAASLIRRGRLEDGGKRQRHATSRDHDHRDGKPAMSNSLEEEFERKSALGARRGRRAMDRFIDTIEWIAAFFIGIVALDIFISVVLRAWPFSTYLPDSYAFGQLLLGILIFWGIAATSYRGTHITVDLVWAAAGPRGKRWIDVFATLVLLFVVTVHTIMLFEKVTQTYAANVLTADTRTPTWPFFAVAWAGDVSAVLLIAIRTWRLVFHPDEITSPLVKTAE